MIDNGWIMSYWGGHNGAVACFNYKTSILRVFEIEKLTGLKHLRPYEEVDSNRWSSMLREVCESMLNNEVPLQFEHVIGGIPESRGGYHITEKQLHEVGIEFNTYDILPEHHKAHAYTNIMHTDVDRAVIWAFDAAGDDGPNQFYTFDRYDEDGMIRKIPIYDDDWDGWSEKWFENLTPEESIIEKRRILRQNPGNSYWKRGAYSLGKIARNTYHTADLPGKIMGASAFGKSENIDTEKFLQEERELEDYVRYPERRSEMIERQSLISPFQGNSWIPPFNHKDLTFQEECDRSLFIQQRFEEETITRLESTDMIRLIKENGNTLLLSGGCALNVVMNQKLQEKYDIRIEVPPVPNDIGIAVGLVMRYVYQEGLISRETKVDTTFAGPYISENNWFDKTKDFSEELLEYKNRYINHHTIGDVNNVAQLLKDGHIVGMVQGRSECGLRALGARSILCDASYPDMKDKINKVKRREPYRPFAPMCKVEDAPKYFDSPWYDNLAHMNINVTVKEEYRNKLRSITHVDGTARLQTVDTDYPLVYNLLDAHGGVLLNTSFNVAGKPILNTFTDAFKILESSEMDYLVIYDHVNDKYAIFTSKLENGY